eukprot:scaffold75361_cov55-Phaeocystis_antarctica.AAC.1
MARIGLEGGPPRFNFAASLAAFAALCFIVQGLAGFTAQWMQRPTFGSWGKANCPTVEQGVRLVVVGGAVVALGESTGPARLGRARRSANTSLSLSLALQVTAAANPWAYDAMLDVDE